MHSFIYSTHSIYKLLSMVGQRATPTFPKSPVPSSLPSLILSQGKSIGTSARSSLRRFKMSSVPGSRDPSIRLDALFLFWGARSGGGRVGRRRSMLGIKFALNIVASTTKLSLYHCASYSTCIRRTSANVLPTIIAMM